MKRLLHFTLTIVFLISLFGNAPAQLSINKGLKGGLNFANLSLDPKSVHDYSYYSGIVAGFYLEADILGPMSFQGELLFSQKGAKFNTNTQEVSIRLNYIEIPVLLKFSIPIVPTLSFNIQGGLYLGKKLSENWNPISYKPGEDFFKNSDYGITFGVGVKFNALFNNICIDTRYSAGFANISQDEGEAKNKNFVITVGIRF